MKRVHRPDIDLPGLLVQTSPPEPAVVDQIAFSDLVLDGSLPRVTIRLVDRSGQSARSPQSAGSLLTELQCEV